MVATADRSINPDQERMMAKRANAKTVEVNSSHVAYISHAKEPAKLIEEAATSVTKEVATSAPSNRELEPDMSAEDNEIGGGPDECRLRRSQMKDGISIEGR